MADLSKARRLTADDVDLLSDNTNVAGTIFKINAIEWNNIAPILYDSISTIVTRYDLQAKAIKDTNSENIREFATMRGSITEVKGKAADELAEVKVLLTRKQELLEKQTGKDRLELHGKCNENMKQIKYL